MVFILEVSSGLVGFNGELKSGLVNMNACLYAIARI